MIFIEPGTKAKDRMMSYIPDFYRSSRIMNELMRTRGNKLDFSIKAFDEILNQFFIATATWQLAEYEKQYGLPTNQEDSMESRRNQVLAKKRSGRGKLVKILQAVEPTISIAWSSERLPFLIQSDRDYYNFKELIILMNKHAPAHRAYSFRVEKPENSNIGYTVYMNRVDRFNLHKQLISGTTNAGRFPKRSTIGTSIHKKIEVSGYQITGTADLPRSAGLVSGKKKQIAFGVSKPTTLNISNVSSTGISKPFRCGTKVSGEGVA